MQVREERSKRMPGMSTMTKGDCAKRNVEDVISELRMRGLNVKSGNVKVCNKPTINSNNGG